MNHFVVLPILLPAISAALTVFLPPRQIVLARMIALISVLILAGVAGLNLLRGETQAYFLGSWPAPFGIVLVLDPLSALMVALSTTLGFITLLAAVIADHDRQGRHFHALFLFQLMGLNGAFLTADAFNLFVFFEVLLIASYGLMVHGGRKASLHAGIQYVAYNLLASAIFLVALAVIYALTGTLNMADMAQKLPLLPAEDAALIRVSAILLLIVFLVKGAAFPFQFWLPRSYAASPAPVAALFSILTKVGAYAVIRFGTLVYPQSFGAIKNLWSDVISISAFAGLMIGAFGVFGATSMRQVAGYAAIGSMGLIFCAIAVGTPAATAAALYYTVHSTLALAALFLLVEQIVRKRGSDAFSHAGPALGGQTLLSGLFLVAAMNAVGFPPFAGFIGKLAILESLRPQAAYAWPIVLFTSLVTLIGFARAGSALIWKGSAITADAAPTPLRNILPLSVLLVLMMIQAAFADGILLWMHALAEGLFRPSAYSAAQFLAKGV